MKIKKFKKTLSRLSVLINTMDDNERLSKLEKDLIRKHLLDLYDLTLAGDENQEDYTELQEDVVQVVPKQRVAPVQRVEVLKEEPVQERAERAVVEEPVRQKTYIDLEPSISTPKETEVQIKEETVPVVAVEQPVTETNAFINEEHAEILEYGSENNELSDRLGDSPISDLTKAMGINERMLTVNELFDGDNSAFKQSLSALNEMSSYNEAKSYISNQLIEKYNWVSPKKRKKAKVFIKLVKRRFN